MRLTPLPLSLRQLQYAVAVAEALSFRRAAERCHVSQPSLSAQLAELEQALGVRLFERDRRGVLPTRAGQDLLPRARRILLEAEDLRLAARELADPLAGTLAVGVIPTISAYLLPSVSPALRERFPRLRLAWTEDRTSDLLARLEAGTLDAAVLALEADIGDVEREVVATDAFRLALPVGHELAGTTGPATLADLQEASVLLLDDGHCFRDQALAYCSRARTRELEFRATSLSTLAQMVAGGAGVTLLPELALATETRRAQLVIRPLADPAPRRTIALVWRRRSPLAAALREVARAMAAAYPQGDTLDARPPVAARARGKRPSGPAGRSSGA
jgi:LysR family hydrogen peroxide-inducible transcriptional activator